MENFHGTASSNKNLIEDLEREGKIPKKEQEELPTMVPISILEQEGAANIDFEKKIYLILI